MSVCVCERESMIERCLSCCCKTDFAATEPLAVFAAATKLS